MRKKMPIWMQKWIWKRSDLDAGLVIDAAPTYVKNREFAWYN